ncbi:MAG: FG-GAP-like repeat-containing protein, partial [Pseudomonadota bacterium]
MLGLRSVSRLIAVALWAGAFALPSVAQEVEFTDIARDPATGLSYARAPSPRDAIFDALKAREVYLSEDIPFTPMKSRGANGIAIFDVDDDGDLDLYLTNGPGAANSLFESAFAQTGQMTFVDVGVDAGVAASDQDSSGTCAGDLDNDGDPDLLVLGTGEPNRLFRNDGGTFTDIALVDAAGERLEIVKVATTPERPDDAVIAGIRTVLEA